MPSDNSQAATNAQLLAGWAFVWGMGLLFVVAAAAGLAVAVLERRNMRNKNIKSVPIDRSSYLAHLIYSIIEQLPARPVATPHHHGPGQNWAAYGLAGGAQLWYEAETRQLAAVRSNVTLEPGEANVFANYIAKAGYTAAGVGIRIFIDEGLNAWKGVVWQIERPAPAADVDGVSLAAIDATASQAQATQGVLF